MTPVLVVGQPAMVVEVGTAGLRQRGLDAHVWAPGSDAEGGAVLLLHHEDDAEALRELVVQVRAIGRPWVALVATPSARVRRYLSEVGASEVLGSDAGLDAAVRALTCARASDARFTPVSAT